MLAELRVLARSNTGRKADEIRHGPVPSGF